MKRCWNCKKIKSFEDFYKDSSRGDGLTPECKSCKLAYKKESRKTNPLQEKEYRRNYRVKHKQRLNEYHRDYYRKTRAKVLMAYGGKCVCCGESRIEFLAFDHINGGGSKHRKSNNGQTIARWLLKNNFPPGFQILCHNCNMAKGFYGCCPHEKERHEANTPSVTI